MSSYYDESNPALEDIQDDPIYLDSQALGSMLDEVKIEALSGNMAEPPLIDSKKLRAIRSFMMEMSCNHGHETVERQEKELELRERQAAYRIARVQIQDLLKRVQVNNFNPADFNRDDLAAAEFTVIRAKNHGADVQVLNQRLQEIRSILSPKKANAKQVLAVLSAKLYRRDPRNIMQNVDVARMMIEKARDAGENVSDLEKEMELRERQAKVLHAKALLAEFENGKKTIAGDAITAFKEAKAAGADSETMDGYITKIQNRLSDEFGFAQAQIEDGHFE